MDTATGVFLLAVGAILKFAVHASVSGIELGTVGVILMIAGGLIVLMDLLRESRWRDHMHRRNRLAAEERVDPRV